jgi:hypothetical protein
MAEETLPGEYTFQLSADEFVKILLASDDAFQAMKVKGEVPIEIDRVDGDDPETISTLTKCGFQYTPGEKLIFFRNIKIVGNVQILNQQILCRSLFLYCCSFQRVAVTNSVLTNNNNEGLTNFIFNNCLVEDFWIEEKSTLGNFRVVNNTTMRSFILHDNSTCQEVLADVSTMHNISVNNKSNCGRLIIQNSTVNGISINQRSTSGFIRIDKSTCSSIEIMHFSVCSAIVIMTNSKTSDIQIANNSIVGDVDINEQSTAGNLTILHSCGVGNLTVKDHSTAGKLNTHKSTLGYINVSNHSVIGNITIENHTATDNITIDNSTLGSVVISNFSTTGHVSLSNNSSAGDFAVSKESVTGNFHVENSLVGNFTAEQLYCSFYMTSARFLIVQLKDCHLHEFKMNLACKLEAYLTAGQINILDLRKTTLSKEALLSFSGTSIYSILMEDFSMMGSLYFRKILKPSALFEWIDTETENYRHADSKVNANPALSGYNEKRKQWLTQKKENYEAQVLLFFAQYKLPIIKISQSSLGRTEFIDCPLADFHFQYNNSKITECFIMGSTLPGGKIEIVGVEEMSLKEQQKASIYNQFRKIFEAQGDLYSANQFQASWARHQQRYLVLKEEGLTRKKTGLFRKIGFSLNETSQDICTLRLNKISNNYGESWLRALFLILSIGLVFYIAYLATIGRLQESKFDWNLLGYYFEYLNPVHKTNFIDEKTKVSGLTVFIDFTGRLLIAFLIYQFVAAFRKNSKK